MELYVELNVSLKETSICVVDGSGEIVSEGAVISEPSAIAAFIPSVSGQRQAARCASVSRPARRRPGSGMSSGRSPCR